MVAWSALSQITKRFWDVRNWSWNTESGKIMTQEPWHRDKKDLLMGKKGNSYRIQTVFGNMREEKTQL